MPRVKPAIEAGFIGSAEAANAYMRQLLIRISYLPVLSPFRPVVFFHWPGRPCSHLNQVVMDGWAVTRGVIRTK